MSEHKFKHFLKINDNPRVEISEPFGFDGSTINIEQEKGKHSRNITIFNGSNQLELHRMDFERISDFNYKNHLFDEVKNEIKTKGWELEVEYILEFEGNAYSTGKIDGLTYELKKDFISFNITQNTLLKIIKVNEDVSIDAFSNKDLSGNSIEACESMGIFLKAKPLLQKSSWESAGEPASGLARVIDEEPTFPTPTGIHAGRLVFRAGANNCIAIKEYGIRNTLNFLSPTYALNQNGFPVNNGNFYFLEAQTTLTDVKLKIRDLIAYTSQVKTNGFGTNVVLSGSGYARLVVKYGFNDNVGANLTTINLYEKNFGFVNSTPIEYLPTDYDLNIPIIQQGMWLWCYLEPYAQATFPQNGVDSLASYQVICVMQSMKLEITATSTAISTVVKGIRLKDLLQHQARSINFNLIDNVFTQNEYLNNFVFNGRMLANLNDLPFNTKFKELMGSVCDEAFADYQINDDNVIIDKITDFYKDVEIARFDELPALTNSTKPNIDYAIKKIEIGFNKSSDDRTGNAEGTSDDVHTKMEINYPTDNTEGILKIEFKHIRSAFLIEEQRRKGNEVEEKTKSLENDENVFLLDCVPMPPNQRNKFTQFLNCQITNSTDILTVISNGTFNWLNLGMIVGQQVNIYTQGFSADRFRVLELTPFLAKFKFLNYQPNTDFSGEFSLTFSYVLQGVQFTNRTNEGFSIVEGINNPSAYSNLNFSLKRILNKWSSILGNSSQYLPNKELKVTEIKVNNKLVTKLANENESVVDFAPILTNDVIPNKFLTGAVYYYKVFANFTDMLQLAQDVRNLRGYVTVLTNENEELQGYVNKMEYKIFEQELMLTLFEKK